jgi:hypothetical protein
MEQLLTSNIAAIVMAGGFIWYLMVKDKRNKETFSQFNQTLLKVTNGFNKSLKDFNKTLTNHLSHQLEASKDLACAFTKLSDLISELIKQEKQK